MALTLVSVVPISWGTAVPVVAAFQATTTKTTGTPSLRRRQRLVARRPPLLLAIMERQSNRRVQLFSLVPKLDHLEAASSDAVEAPDRRPGGALRKITIWLWKLLMLPMVRIFWSLVYVEFGGCDSVTNPPHLHVFVPFVVPPQSSPVETVRYETLAGADGIVYRPIRQRRYDSIHRIYS
jgi:hypothetical protein